MSDSTKCKEALHSTSLRQLHSVLKIITFICEMPHQKNKEGRDRLSIISVRFLFKDLIIVHNNTTNQYTIQALISFHVSFG